VDSTDGGSRRDVRETCTCDVVDYAELNPLGTSGSNAESILNSQIEAVRTVDDLPRPATVMRGSATDLPAEVPLLDAVITDLRTTTTCPMRMSRITFMYGRNVASGICFLSTFRANSLRRKKRQRTFVETWR